MNPVRLVARIFIDLFGITAPEPENRAKLEWTLFLLSVGVVVALGMFFWLILHVVAG